jgi:PAS domain S-box-containing protein
LPKIAGNAATLGFSVSSELVVIIDDGATHLKILERLANSLGGWTVAQAFNDAEAALSFCRENRPGLIVLAAATAQGEAAGFIHKLRRIEGCAEVPIIVIGAEEDLDCLERAREAGATDHLLLPINHRDFRLRARSQLAPFRDRPRGGPDHPPPNGRARDGERRQDGLRQAHEMLLRVLDAIPRMICVTGQDGRYLLVNRHYAAFVGVRASRLIGKSPLEAHGGPMARHLIDTDPLLLAGRPAPISSEEEIVDREGQPRVLLATKSVFHGEDGEDSMVVTVWLDITERKRAEHDLLAAKEQAELANRSKTEFLANMSHETRTPLNAIIGFSQVIAGEMLGPIGTPKYIGYAHDILISAEHLLGIINDILDLSKLEAGKLDLAEEVIELPKTMEDLLQLADAKARASEIRIVLRCEGALPALRADARKVKQIVLNLLINAIKFSHAGGEVAIVLRNRSGAVTIDVVDHGIGMDAEEVRLAMTRFGQVASAWTRKHDGTGLGLPLAIGLTELHDGTLTIRSTKGVGTTVIVAFPRDRSQPLHETVEVRAVAQS